MDQKIVILQEKLQHIVDSTINLDFPWLTTFEEKQLILQCEKNKVETQIGKLLKSYGFEQVWNTIDFLSLWMQADMEARRQFGNLNEEQMLNGFYFQEVMHRYSELLIKAIMAKINFD